MTFFFINISWNIFGIMGFIYNNIYMGLLFAPKTSTFIYVIFFSVFKLDTRYFNLSYLFISLNRRIYIYIYIYIYICVSVSLDVYIYIYIYIYADASWFHLFCDLDRLLLWLLEFFTSALADGLSLEFEWQQVSSSLQESSQYSGHSQ